MGDRTRRHDNLWRLKIKEIIFQKIKKESNVSVYSEHKHLKHYKADYKITFSPLSSFKM